MKLNQVIGFLAKEESEYGTAETLSASNDGVNVYIGDGDPEPPTPYEYVFDGKLGRAASSLAPQRRTTPNGRFRSGQIKILPKGLGAAYSSSSVTPPRELHRLLKAAGFTATFDTDHWEYTPTAAGSFTSLTLRQYAQASQFDMAGVICDMSFESQGLGVPVMAFDYRGLASLPADQSLPAITVLAPDVIAPVAAGVVLSIGDFETATVRRVAYRSNRSIDNPRIAQNLAGGHAGFVPGGMAPEIEIEIERPARSTYDPEAVLAAATEAELSIAYSGGENNEWSVAAPVAQLSAVTPGAEGGVATVTLVFALSESTPGENDFVQIDVY